MSVAEEREDRGDAADGPIHCNEVLLIGRVSAVLEPRQLPSGDVLACFRLVVQRPAAARGPGERGARVDVLDCQTARAGLRRLIARLQPGEQIEVHGALRRRFLRAAGGPASRHEIEVSALRRLDRPPSRPTRGAAARVGTIGERTPAGKTGAGRTRAQPVLPQAGKSS